MRLKILSDGTVGGSRLVDAATGEQIENVTFIELKIDPAQGVKALIHFQMLEVDLMVETGPVSSG